MSDDDNALEEWMNTPVANEPVPDSITMQVGRLLEPLDRLKDESTGELRLRLVEATSLIRAQDKARKELNADINQQVKDLREQNKLIRENGKTMHRMQQQLTEKDCYIAELQEEIEFLRSRS